MDLRVVGAERLSALSKALKDAPKELSSELTKGITRVVKPLKQSARDSARSMLPRRGGLGRRVARTRLSHKRRSGSDAWIRITGEPGAVKEPFKIDRGKVLHPVYGHRAWVLQDVRQGWFTKPMTEGAPVVRKELVAVMDIVASKIAR